MARTAADQVRSEDLFTTALWGYSMDEVDAYVEDTARRMRRLAAEIQRLSVAENQLGAARIEISKLTSELAEARPLAGVGPRVQAILRMAEREAETLRRTAFEVLRNAYEEARGVRQKAEDEAYQAKRDYELALAHRRQHDKDELLATVLAEAAADPEPEPAPRETVGMRELFASANKGRPAAGAAAVEQPPVEAGSDLESAPDREAERDIEPVKPAAAPGMARPVGPMPIDGRAAGVAPMDVAAADHEPIVVGAQRDEPEAAAHAVPEVLEDEYPVIEEPVERFHNGSNKSRRKRARNQRANPANPQPAASPDPAETLPAKRR
ncbi:hypothetical protein [Catellatospora citrea]|uniref:Uncharacterized protein n=1 Tax=Catellatospora citrea TaxID=53366 RepID=A0A8J3KL20_9ACTN|nr:hypothetical protein [Catellatospora citrea]RKE10387.1 hypothetical protein C8E86_5283 [Catellatospora citrea]GIF99108.1 hypothetical protein Cci01nite_42020 [Catellatospora citrea]